MNEKMMTCIVCPRGCRMKVTFEGDKMLSCTGNFCKRGADYARAEIAFPVRVLTSTVALNSYEVPRLPVKTSAPIPKDKLFEAMEKLKTLKVSVPIKHGDIIFSDFISKGINLISCRSVNS